MKTRALILPLLVLGIGAIEATPRQITPKLIPAFDKSSKGMRYSANPRNHIYWEVRRVSPDQKFVACITVGDGEVGFLRVYKYDNKTKKPLVAQPVTRFFSDAQGCVWVPKHGHWLVVSVGGYDDVELPERGKIMLWSGNKGFRLLRQAKNAAMEGFDVRGVSSSGRYIIYEHYGPGSPDPNYKRNKRLKLYLTRS